MSLLHRLLPRRLRARLLAGNVALALLVLAVFAVLLVVLLSSQDAARRSSRSAQVSIAASALERDVLLMQSGSRGFALTGQEAFLEPWRDALAVTAGHGARLAALAADDPRQAAIVARLRREVFAYEYEWSSPIVRLVRLDRPSAVARIATGGGRRRVAAITAGFDRLFARERELGRRREQLVTARRTLALVVLAIGALVLIGFALLQQLALHRWLLRPLEAIGDTTRRLEAGDLDARAPAGSSDAVGALGASVNAMAEALEDRDAELKRSNRELEEFAYIASHDLAEPLRAMGGYADLLGRRYGDQLDDRAGRYLDGITAGAERMRRLIDDLLAYSRVGRRELELQPVDFEALIETVRDDLSVAIAETEAQVVSHDLPTVQGDPGQLRMVLQNLVANAIKFRGEQPPRVEISARADGDCWTFTVADNGIGVEPRHAERIFRMFQRLHTREEYAGTGIGLALAQRVLQRHEGRIWVEPGSAGGSVFSFTLPREG